MICVGQQRQFTASGTALDEVDWSTDPAGDPATGSGPTFTTKWDEPGEKTVTAECNTSSEQSQVTVVAVEAIIVDGADPQTAPQEACLCLAQTIRLRAVRAPQGTSWPSSSPKWTLISKPAGSARTDNDLPDGSAVVEFEPDVAGLYVIKAACGDHDPGATFDLEARAPVDIEKIVIEGTEDEGPAVVCLGASIILEAVPVEETDPYCPAWLLLEKPEDSALPNPPPGRLAVIEPDVPGTYEIQAACGESTAIFNLNVVALRFLKNDNDEIDPETLALNVSNYVTDNGLPSSSAFDATADDPDNFRLEVEDHEESDPSVSVTLTVGSGSGTQYTLDKKSDSKFRGEFLRLVTDSADDGVQGSQTIRCELGNEIVLKYGDCEHTIEVGRPTAESDNSSNQLKHDIRELKVNVVVFSKPGTTQLDGAIDNAQATIKVVDVSAAHPSGVIKIENEVIEYTGIDTNTNEFTGCTRGAEGTTAAAHADTRNVLYSTTTPAVTEGQVNSDIDLSNQRLGQATVRLNVIGLDIGSNQQGHVPPSALLDNYTSTPGVITSPTSDEQAIVQFKDGASDVVDVFYVDVITTGAEYAEAYPKARNNTGNPDFQNFIVLTFTDRSTEPFVLPHEFMHILLNAPHRANEPDTALFNVRLGLGNIVTACKRIGPYPDATANGVGQNDTFTIRNASENLPQ